jgi:hypothetical protein
MAETCRRRFTKRTGHTADVLLDLYDGQLFTNVSQFRFSYQPLPLSSVAFYSPHDVTALGQGPTGPLDEARKKMHFNVG